MNTAAYRDPQAMLRQICLVFIFVSVIHPTSSRADRYTMLGDYVSHVRDARAVTITAANNVLRLTVAGEGAVRVQVGRDGRLLDIPSYTVRDIEQPQVAWTLEERTDRLVLALPAGRIEIMKTPLRLRMLDLAGAEIASDDPAFGHGWDGKEVHVWKTLHSDERFYGLGEKTGDVDKRGTAYTMWNSDIPGYTNDRDPIYSTIPFFIGLRNAGAYGIFFDNTYRSTFNMGAASDRVYSFGAEDGEMNYWFVFGPLVKDVVARYTAITGRMPLPPLWALGYQQCRWNYYPEYEVRDLAKNFRQRSIPADVIYLDIRYMDHYKVFTWDRTAFPDPSKLCADLRAQGFRLVTIIDPGIKVEPGYDAYEEGVRDGHFATYPDGTLYKGQVWPGWCHFPDFTRGSTRDWWGRRNAEMMRTGVAGFWNDMNEPAVWGREFPYLVEFDDGGRRSTIKKIHNAYAYLEAQATYEGVRAHVPDTRPFIVSRAAYAGQQKYSAIWTGDNVARFEDLGMAVRMCIGLGLSGVPFTGADVGGFMDSPTSELMVRWMQAGAFTPFFRTHTVINTRDQEPWSFGEEMEDNMRSSISLRYRLLPYVYTAFREASVTGLPIMRPMFLEFQDDPRVYEHAWQQQYLFGSSILVAPIFIASQAFQKIYFPAGTWIDAQNGAVYAGGREVIVDAPWWKIPYYYRAGRCVPTRDVQQHTGERPLTDLVLDVAAGADGASSLYLDAGDGFGYEKGKFDELTFTLAYTTGRIGVRIASTRNEWARGIRTVTLRVYNVQQPPAAVRVNAAACTETSSGTPGIGEYMYDAAMHVCTLRTAFEAGRESSVEIDQRP